MKYNFSQKVILGSLLFSATFSPIFTAAETPVASPTNNSKESICLQIDTLSTQKIADAEDKQTKFQERYTEEVNKLADNQTKADAELQTKRDEAESLLFQKITAFSEEASTTEQKDAISHFQDALKTARDSRKTALDTAIKTFRDGVASTSDMRKGLINDALLSFQTSVASAFEKAKTDCANNISPDVVRTNLRLAITTAQEKLKSDKLVVLKVGTSIDLLIKVRKQSVAKAVVDYKLTIRKAKANLRLGFPVEKK